MALYDTTKLEFYFNLEFSKHEFSHEMFEKLHEIAISIFEYEFGPISETQGIDIGGIYFGDAHEFSRPRMTVCFINKDTKWMDSISVPDLLLRVQCFVVDRLENNMYNLFPELLPK